MIRNAVVHLIGEQPLFADLFDQPAAGDVSLVCTNLRMRNGKRPAFADHSDSLFVFPYGQIRFVEIPPGTSGLPALATGEQEGAGGEEPEPEPDVEIDEEFLRRIREV